MILLVLFAFIAGAGTALSPCVLPILPAILSAGVTGGRRRPLGIVTGLALSFTFATVALVYVIDALGLPDDLTRKIAIVVLAAFGISLLVPPVSDRIEAYIQRLVPAPSRPAREGFGGGLLLGGSLGFVYAPCAGPILAGVITVSASQTFTFGRPGGRARVLDRLGGGALRPHPRRAPDRRPPEGSPGAHPDGDGSRDGRRRGRHGHEPRRPLRELDRPAPAVSADRSGEQDREELGDLGATSPACGERRPRAGQLGHLRQRRRTAP